MKIRITDLPVGGEDIQFQLSLPALNKRAHAPIESAQETSFLPLAYEFIEEPTVKLHVEPEGITLFIEGDVSGKFKTECARCNEVIHKDLSVPVKMILKPFRADEKKEEQIEDLGFGFYDGKEVDCAEIAEESLMLALPFNALCSEDCKGLCTKCGANLNMTRCGCSVTKAPDPRFAVLHGLKIQ